MSAGSRALLRSAAIVALLVGCAAWFPSRAYAQEPAWVKLAPPATVGLHVRDAKRDREIFFDEAGLVAVPDAPVVIWQRIWTGVPPASASRDLAFYDPARDRIWTMTRVISNTLELRYMDLSADSLKWTLQPVTWSPAALADTVVQDFGFAFDEARDRIVTYGGRAGCFGCPGSATSDVRALSLAGSPRWTHEPVDGPGPSPRMNPAMVYDPWRDRVVVYGGVAFGPIYFDETWVLSAGAPMSWALLNPTRLPPPGRIPATSVLDSLGRRWFIHGIASGSGGADTYALDLSASVNAGDAAWTEIAPGANTVRPPAVGALFEQRALARLSTYDGDAFWTLSLGATPTWTLLGGGMLGLVRRNDLICFVDTLGQRIYAGLGPNISMQVRSLSSDGPWTTLSAVGPGQGPFVRYGSSAVSDDPGGRALVFGGADLPHEYTPSDEFSELWSFDFASQTWALLDASAPPLPRSEGLAVFDHVRRRMILHGGRYTNPQAVSLGDTWFYDAAAGTWSSSPVGSYGGRWGEVGIYDSVRDRVVTFGGTDAGHSIFTDVHVLPLGPTVGSWSTLATSGTPPSWSNLPGSLSMVEALAAAFDPVGDRMIVMAGTGPSTEIWALTLGATPTWSQVSASGVAPAQRFGAALVRAPSSRRFLLVGGSPNGSNLNTVGDSWALDFEPLTVADELALMSADATPDQVTLHWYTGQSGSVLATVYRREDGDGWRALGQGSPDGTGVLSWIDRDVVPGGSYDYRLGVSGATAERFYGETHIDVPVLSTMSLAGTRPNPSDGPVRVSFSLADRSLARLELLDVSGRLISGRDVGGLGDGVHVVRLDVQGERLPAGLYFVRLSQAGRELRSKTVIIR